MNRIFFCIICSITGIASSVHGQGVLPAHRYYNARISSLTWDNTANNNVIDNGSGTWNTGTRWVKSPPAGADIAWVSGANAIFGGNPGNGAAGTVTVSGTQTVKSITFNPTPSGNFILTGGTLSLQSGIITVNQDATINSTITGSANYLQRGTGTLNLGGSNSFSGTYTISQGTFQLGSGTAGGTASFILGDAQTGNDTVSWQWAGSTTPGNSVTVTANGTGKVIIGAYSAGTNTQDNGALIIDRPIILYDMTSDRTTFSGIVSGSADTITIDGTGTWNSSAGTGARVTFENNSNSFTGIIIINPSKALQLSGTDVVNNQPIQNNGSLVLNAGQNNTTTIGTLTGASTGICEIHATVTGPQTLSIGNDNGNGTYSGIIRNAGTGSSQVMNIIKAGTGTEIFTGTNTYTGTTSISGGILGGTGSISSSSATTITSGGTIMGGTGSGNAGIFTTGNLTFTTASTAAVNVYSDGSSLSKVQVNGTCALGTTSKINLMDAMPTGTYTIISSTGTMTGTLPTLGTNLSGHTVTIQKTGNNLQVKLT
ncbi:beta strand repeat-containing protein [Chitinophagaceae bacterium MMS25-I14]